MVSPKDIEQALSGVRDQASFLRLLAHPLGWPIDGERVEDLSYTWTERDLRAAGLSTKVVESRIFQIANLDRNQPWGVFVIEFKNPDAFIAVRGMTGVLRQVLRGLVPSKRKDANQPSWKREHLLFICTHKYNHFRLAYFKSPPEGSKTAPLAAFGWGPDIPARTACEFNLPALEWPDNPADSAGWVAAWADAFNVEKVTKRFYTEYAEQFERLRAVIRALKGEDQKMFTQALMNRLLFLRFIERKGWLMPPSPPADGNSRDYLGLLFQAGGHRGKSFYSGRLKKLFFEALAVEGKQQSDAVGKVPFLNGGLFEESDLDKRVDDIPDSAFAPLLGHEGLLYRYNFTVQESTPLDIEVAVDPEMLGKVFEELVTGRHESGSYYTPRPVVSFMCREALKGYLADATQIDADRIAAFVDKHDVTGIPIDGAKKIAQALDEVRAVDPACGSGAYLLGLLHEIVDLYRLLYSNKLKASSREIHKIKLDIIEKCLYGTDIDPFATNIAMLRLWLSLTVDSNEPQALPNLDFKIETGDALTGPNPQDMPDLLRSNLDERARQLAIIKGKYMRARGDQKKSLRELVQHEQREISFKLRSLSPGAIDWRVQFCEVFFPCRAGFDIVLANPPYVRKEAIDPAIKPVLSTNFAGAITGRSDLYCSFYARALQLLRPGGIQAFVCSSAWLDAEYGGPLQNYLLRHGHVRAIYDSAVEKQFSTANVNTIISVVQKKAPTSSDNPITTFILLMAPFEIAISERAAQRVTVADMASLRRAGMINGEVVGDKWGGKYLRAPAIYQHIISHCSSRLVLLAEAATIIGYIHDSNTGPAFPLERVLWQVKSTEVISVNNSSACVQSVGINPSGNSSMFAPLLFARQHGFRHIVVHAAPPVLGKEFYRITPRAPWDEANLAAQLNSTWTILQRELLGIKGFGGGALKFAARDVGLFYVVQDVDSVALARAMASMQHRVISHGPAELEQPDRRQLDAAVFDALGLTHSERQAVYDAVLELIDMRANRAAS